MEDTFDEFSELVAANANFLPPSASHTVVTAAQRAALSADDENLSNGYGGSSEDDGDNAGGNGTPFQRGETDGAAVGSLENDNEEAQGRGSGDGFEDALPPSNDVDLTNDDHDAVADGDDGAVDVDDIDDEGIDEMSGGSSRGRSVESARDDNEEASANTGRTAPLQQRHTAQGSVPLPFAISRIKALFRFAHESARIGSGETELPLCVLSSEAASVLSEAAGLMLADLVTAASGETQRKDKKTLSYEDVAYIVSQLDRYSFLSEVVPSAGPGPKAAAGKPRQSVAHTATAPTAQPPSTKPTAAKPKTTRNQRTAGHPQPQAAPEGTHGGMPKRRQLTLNFGSAAKPLV